MACISTTEGNPVSHSPPTDPISPPTNSTTIKEWNGWKLQHKKVYVHDREELLRQKVWMSNKKFIEEYNLNLAKKTGYTLAMNQFGDMVRNYSEYYQALILNLIKLLYYQYIHRSKRSIPFCSLVQQTD